MKEENRRADEWLSRYKALKREERLLSSKIRNLKEATTSIQINLDGLPKSTVTRTIADYVAEIDELAGELQELIERELTAYKEIEKMIRSLNDRTQQEILTRKYLLQYSWERIIHEAQYSRSHIFKKYNDALVEITLKLDSK